MTKPPRKNSDVPWQKPDDLSPEEAADLLNQMGVENESRRDQPIRTRIPQPPQIGTPIARPHFGSLSGAILAAVIFSVLSFLFYFGSMAVDKAARSTMVFLAFGCSLGAIASGFLLWWHTLRIFARGVDLLERIDAKAGKP